MPAEDAKETIVEHLPQTTFDHNEAARLAFLLGFRDGSGPEKQVIREAFANVRQDERGRMGWDVTRKALAAAASLIGEIGARAPEEDRARYRDAVEGLVRVVRNAEEEDAEFPPDVRSPRGGIETRVVAETDRVLDEAHDRRRG